MKVLYFENGPIAQVKTLPGERPEAELEELLGGETELRPLSRRLTMAVRRDGEAQGLPRRYAVTCMGRAPETVAGPVAVLAVGPGGVLRDMDRKLCADVPVLMCALDPEAG